MQFPRVGGSDSQQYAVAVRLHPNQSLPSDALVHQHSARTCGRRAHHLFPSDLELVKWNEIFFFKVDSVVLDNYACFHFFLRSNYAGNYCHLCLYLSMTKFICDRLVEYIQVLVL